MADEALEGECTQDSQATELVDLVSDDDEEVKPSLTSLGCGNQPCSQARPLKADGRGRGTKRPRNADPASQVSEKKPRRGAGTLHAPLDGSRLLHLSVALDEDGGLADADPRMQACVVPQANPADRCLTLQQLLHPRLEHVKDTAGLQGIVATTYVGGAPKHLRDLIYDGQAAKCAAAGQDGSLSLPVSPPCPVVLVVHGEEMRGRARPEIRSLPSSSGFPLTLVSPALPSNAMFGTAHTKLLLVRWGPGVLHQHGTVRLIVMTANLCDADLEECYQCAWAQDFPVVPSGTASMDTQQVQAEVADAEPSNTFYVTISSGLCPASYVRYFLGEAGLGVPTGDLQHMLADVDWSGIGVDFVASVAGKHVWPGTHQWSALSMSPFMLNGLHRLTLVRRLQMNAVAKCKAVVQDSLAPAGTAERPPASKAFPCTMQRIWSQVSSLGSTTDAAFNLSLPLLAAHGVLNTTRMADKGGHLACFPGPIMGPGGEHPGKAVPEELRQQVLLCLPPPNRKAPGSARQSTEASDSTPFVLFWPSFDFVRDSRHRSVSNVRLQAKQVANPKFARFCLHHFHLNESWFHEPTVGPLPRCAPSIMSPLTSHTKLLGPMPEQACSIQPEGETAARIARDWLVMGSHNMSRSAWGFVSATKATPPKLTVNNHELSVLFPVVLQVHLPGQVPMAKLEQRLREACGSALVKVSMTAPTPHSFVHSLSAPPLSSPSEPWTDAHILRDQRTMAALSHNGS